MSVGTVDETEDGGLDDFDAEPAAENLAAVGDDVRARIADGAPGADAGSIPLVGEAQPGETTQLTSPASGDTVPSSAAGPGEYPPPPQFDDLSPPPPAPQLSADPAENTRRLVEWQRQLTEHHAAATQRQSAIAEFSAKVGAVRGAKEAQVAAQKAEQVRLENERAAAKRARAQEAIDSAVRDRLEAKQSLESFKWERPHDGASIAAMILGALGGALQAAGGSTHVENEGIKGIDARLKRDYELKKAKYTAAGDSVLMAKYDVKNAQDAHRAALNDLDADFSARYKRVAAEAEAVLRQQGVPAEQAKGNALVTDALEKAAAHEGQIHLREEGIAAQKEQAHATLKLAQANLGERRSEHQDTLDEKRREFDLRKQEAADKKKASAGGGGVEAAKNSVNFNLYKEHANWIADNAPKLSTDDRERILAIVKSGGLGQVLEAGGALIGLDKEKGLSPLAKEYLGHMREAADGYGRVKSGGAINKDEESRFMDQFVVKPSDTAADIKARGSNIRQNIRVMSPLDRDTPAAAQKPAAGGGGALTGVQAATLLDRLRTHPDDPRAPRIKQKLRDAGYRVP